MVKYGQTQTIWVTFGHINLIIKTAVGFVHVLPTIRLKYSNTVFFRVFLKPLRTLGYPNK